MNAVWNGLIFFIQIQAFLQPRRTYPCHISGSIKSTATDGVFTTRGGGLNLAPHFHFTTLITIQTTRLAMLAETNIPLAFTAGHNGPAPRLTIS